jgi:hypothetical protein
MAFVHLTRRDVVRHKIVADIIDAYERVSPTIGASDHGRAAAGDDRTHAAAGDTARTHAAAGDTAAVGPARAADRAPGEAPED